MELIKELGEFECDLEGRFANIRTQETNLGNFVCDIMVAATNADLALINSGTFRSDQIHSAGPFFLKDLLKILPMIDPLVLLEVTGPQLLECLENGVSMYPKLEGRFPQVSGINFAFDPDKKPGKRIDPEFVKVGDEYLDMDPKSKKTYRLATKAYLANGKDGYDVLAKCKQVCIMFVEFFMCVCTYICICFLKTISWSTHCLQLKKFNGYILTEVWDLETTVPVLVSFTCINFFSISFLFYKIRLQPNFTHKHYLFSCKWNNIFLLLVLIS